MKKIIIAITTLVIMNSCKKNSISPAPQPQPISQATKILGKWNIVSIRQYGIDPLDRDSTIKDLNNSSFNFTIDNNIQKLTVDFNKDLSSFFNILGPIDSFRNPISFPFFASPGRSIYSDSIDEKNSSLILNNLDHFASENGKPNDIGFNIITLSDSTLILYCGLIAGGKINYIGYWTVTLQKDK